MRIARPFCFIVAEIAHRIAAAFAQPNPLIRQRTLIFVNPGAVLKLRHRRINVTNSHSRERRAESARRHNRSGRSDHMNGFSNKPDYKTAQLCKQVFRILGLTLAGDCGDPVLQDLIVASVAPAPNAHHLLITFWLKPGDSPVDLLLVYQRLEKVKGLLRAAIAETIRRKKAPEIDFVLLPMNEVQS